MKKFRFLTLLLSIILSVSVLVSLTACNGGKNDKGSESNNEQTQNPTYSTNPYIGVSNVFEDGCYLLATFEDYEQTTKMKLGWTLGKVTMMSLKGEPPAGTYGKNLIKAAEVPEAVTHGEQCIKVEVLGREALWGVSQFPYLGFKTNGTFFQKIDFTDCDFFLADIYNPMDYNIDMYWYASSNKYEQTIHWRTPFTVTPGMNHVQIPVDTSILAAAPPADLYKNVGDLGFVFQRGDIFTKDQVVYIDNLRARKKV